MNKAELKQSSTFTSDKESEKKFPESVGGNQKSEVFEIQREGETLILIPLINLGELAYQQIESGAEIVRGFLANSTVKNVILDVGRIDYFGTTAISFFLKLWKQVGRLGGHMAFCNLSDHAREILQLTRLVKLWTIYGSKEEALKAIQK